MLSTQIVRRLLWLSAYLCVFYRVIEGAPVPDVEAKGIVLMPVMVPATSYGDVLSNQLHPSVEQFYYQQYLAGQGNNPTHHQTRGPFDFITQYFPQRPQIPGLPIQINVPDMFQNFSTSLGQWSQNVGNGVSQLGQNISGGLNQWTQSVGTGLNEWMQNFGQRVPFLSNIVNNRNKPVDGTISNNNQHQLVVMVPVEYPAGQQLVVEEAIDAFP